MTMPISLRLVWGCFFAAVALVPGATPWTHDSIPNPKTEPNACGQSAPTSICNPDGILRSTGRLQAALDALTADYEYPGCGGYEMGVVVVRSVEDGSAASLERFAKGVMDKWGVGKAQCNNGIVLAVSVDDRKMHVATGRGARAYLPDGELDQVIERMKPLMKEQRYDEAAEQCVSDCARLLSGGSFEPSYLSEYGGLAILPAVFLLICLYDLRNYRRYARCKRVLTQIEHERAVANASRYKVKSCAICLDTFAETPNKELRLLPCGHTFHARCIDGWEESRGTCPICRQPTDPEAAATPTAAASAYAQEHRFRLHRARSLYPDYISSQMVDRWCSPWYSGPIVADTAFIRSSPSFQHSSGGSGGGGSSSFGGGCSFGGGGAGGGW